MADASHLAAAARVQVPLPIGGLAPDQPFESVRLGMHAQLDSARSVGCPLSDPYIAMAFLALPVTQRSS